MAGTYNTSVTQGETMRRVFTWYSGGSLVNLTGFTGAFQVRDRTTGTLQFSGTVTLGGAIGTITVVCAAGDTLVAVGEYVHDLKLTSGTGIVTVLVAGILTIVKRVTQ